MKLLKILGIMTTILLIVFLVLSFVMSLGSDSFVTKKINYIVLRGE